MKVSKSDKFFAFGAEILRSLSRFVLGVAVARWAGPEAYGPFVLMITAEVIVHTVCNSLWTTPMASLAPGAAEPDRSRLMRVAMARHWRGSAIGAGALVLSAPLALDAGVTPLQFAAFLAAVLFAGGLNGTRARLSSSFRSSVAVPRDLWATLFPVAAVAAAWGAGFDVVLAYWASRAVGAAAASWSMSREVPCPTDSGETDLEPFERMGRHMAVGSVANAVCARTQPFVLAALAAPIQVALFGAASALIGPMRMATMALSGVLRPRLALFFGGGDRRKGWLASSVAVGLSASAGIVAILACVFAGEWIGDLAFGDEYVGLAPLLIWAAVHGAAASVNSMLVVVIQIVKDAATTARMRVGVGILSLATVGPLSMTYGAAGAFGSLVAAELLYTAIGVAVLVTGERRRVRAAAVDAPAGPEQPEEPGASQSAKGAEPESRQVRKAA